MGVRDFTFVEVRRDGKWCIANEICPAWNNRPRPIAIDRLGLQLWDIQPFTCCKDGELSEKYHNRAWDAPNNSDIVREWELSQELLDGYATWKYSNCCSMASVDLPDLITYETNRARPAEFALDGLEEVKSKSDMSDFFEQVEEILRAYMQRETIADIMECDVRIIGVTVL